MSLLWSAALPPVTRPLLPSGAPKSSSALPALADHFIHASAPALACSGVADAMRSRADTGEM